MGRLIDADKVLNKYIHAINLEMDTAYMLNMLCDIIDNAPTVEVIPKDQYETRLKADLVAMLTEIQLEIEELEPLASDSVGFDMCVSMSSDIIQQKINALKAEMEDN